jgi:hypothetical protein
MRQKAAATASFLTDFSLVERSMTMNMMEAGRAKGFMGQFIAKAFSVH